MEYKPGEAIQARLEATLPALPIFPLPEVVLLPGAVLPLHIFEPRYRAMTAAVLSQGGILAMATLVPEAGAAPLGGILPAVYPVVGIGEVVAHEELPDGRYNLLLRGIARAWITEELPPDRAYRRVRGRVLEDVVRENSIIESGTRDLIALCDRLSTLIPSGGDRLRALARTEHNPALLVDILGASLIVDPLARRALLEDVDVVHRIERVSGEVATLISQFASHTGPPN
jgi:Lon protease-like protein